MVSEVAEPLSLVELFGYYLGIASLSVYYVNGLHRLLCTMFHKCGDSLGLLLINQLAKFAHSKEHSPILNQ